MISTPISGCTPIDEEQFSFGAASSEGTPASSCRDATTGHSVDSTSGILSNSPFLADGTASSDNICDSTEVGSTELVGVLNSQGEPAIKLGITIINFNY